MSADFSQLPSEVVVFDLVTREPRQAPAADDAFVLGVEAGVPVALGVLGGGMSLEEAVEQAEPLTRFELAPRRMAYFSSAAAIVFDERRSLLVPAREQFADEAEARSAIARAQDSQISAVVFEALPGPRESLPGPGEIIRGATERRRCPGGPRPHTVTVAVGSTTCPDDGAQLDP